MGLPPAKSKGRSPSPSSPKPRSQQLILHPQQRRKNNDSDSKLTSRKVNKKKEELKKKPPQRDRSHVRERSKSPTVRKSERNVGTKLPVTKTVRHHSQVSIPSKPLVNKKIAYDVKHVRNTKSNPQFPNTEPQTWWHRFVSNDVKPAPAPILVEPNRVHRLKEAISSRLKTHFGSSAESSSSDTESERSFKRRGKHLEKLNLPSKTTQESDSYTRRLLNKIRRRSKKSLDIPPPKTEHPSSLKLLVRKGLWNAIGKPYMKRSDYWIKLLEENNVDIDKINIDALDISLINVDQLGIENKALKKSVIWLLK